MALCVEFEFNSIGKRLFGDKFRAGRGFAPTPPTSRQPELGAATEVKKSSGRTKPRPAAKEGSHARRTPGEGNGAGG